MNDFLGFNSWLEANHFIGENYSPIMVIIGVAFIVTVFVFWTYIANEAWMKHTNNPTKNNRAELIVAIAAPVTIPAIAILVGVKWVNDRKSARA